jgi:tRNA(fMet)-specific endonuclease VapC
MQYLLDTNICIYLIKQKPPKVLERFSNLALSDIGISSITVAELEYGVYKSQQQEKNRSALMQFLIPLEIIEFDQAAATVYGRCCINRSRDGSPYSSFKLKQQPEHYPVYPIESCG